jgi:type VI secretion system protein ImpH
VHAWSLGEETVHTVRAAALAGSPKTADAPVPVRDVLPLAARLSAWTRNAEGLRALLEHATGHRVRVLENVPRRVRLAARPRLGAARLGVDAVAGASVLDHAGAFRLQIGPLGLDAFRDLLPGGGGGARVDDLVRLYTSDALDYDVDLLLRAEEAPPLRLGDTSSARLGRTAHVGTPPPPVVRRRVRYSASV